MLETVRAIDSLKGDDSSLDQTKDFGVLISDADVVSVVCLKSFRPLLREYVSALSCGNFAPQWDARMNGRKRCFGVFYSVTNGDVLVHDAMSSMMMIL